mgnify:CR=1 FL=1
MSLRKIAFLTASLAFCALVLTSVMLYSAPSGSNDWSALGLGKREWFAVHVDLGVLFLIAGGTYALLNAKSILGYFKNDDGTFRLFTANFNIALLLTIWMVLSSIFSWPPVNAIRNFKLSQPPENPRIEEIAVETKAMPERAPFFFSRRALSAICEAYGMEPEVVVGRLRDVGIDADAEESIKKIANANDMEPEALYDVIRQLN